MCRKLCCGCCSAPQAPRSFTVPLQGKLFIAVVSLETAALLTLSLLLLLLQDPASPSAVGVVYGQLGVLCCFARIYFAADAVLSENRFQYVVFHVVALMETGFLVMQAVRNPTALGQVWEQGRYPVIGVKLFFELVYAVLAPRTWRSFGWRAFKVVGGSRPLQEMYHRHLAWLSLLKMDAFFSFLLLSLARLYQLNVRQEDFIIGIAALALAIFLTIVGTYAITHESRYLLYVFVPASLLQPAYIADRLYQLWVEPELLPPSVTYTQFAVVGGICVVIRVAVVALALRLSRDFGKGLKAMVFEAARNGYAGPSGNHGATPTAALIASANSAAKSASWSPTVALTGVMRRFAFSPLMPDTPPDSAARGPLPFSPEPLHGSTVRLDISDRMNGASEPLLAGSPDSLPVSTVKTQSTGKKEKRKHGRHAVSGSLNNAYGGGYVE